VSEDTAGDRFAALLRELKDRSGLSYGALAKRLHVSTSSLHRYCNGDAVPTDYAPVERLARACRATPDELVELHRRWVLADALRGRKADAQGAQEAQGARTSPEDVEQAPPAHEEPEAHAPEAPAPTAGTDTRRRTPTRTALVAGIAVAAVLGAVALAVSLPFGGPGDDGDGSGRAGRTAAQGPASGRTHASATPDRSTRPSAPDSASASAPASARASGGNEPEADAEGSATPGGNSTAVPLTVSADPYTWDSPCDGRYLIDRPPTEVAPPPTEADVTAWVAAHGAVSSGKQEVTLTVQGTGEETVVVERLTVRTVARRTPLAWNDYVMGYPGVGCGGNVPTRSFTVALDAARPTVVPEAGHRDFPFKVSESDPEVFHIYADASAYDVRWTLALEWSSGSRHGVLQVDDHGRTFRTSGNNGRPGYEFPLGGSGWVKEGTTVS
jgi:transcriptional regulator with XRE-family HTH domain